MNIENSSTTSESTPLPRREATRVGLERQGGGSARMEWIDAMRGFTMLLVVAYHVSINGYMESPKASTYLSTFVLFRMPLFFFISGFFSYSTKVAWSLQTLGSLTLKKLRIQMLPTVIFFSLFVVVFRPHFWEGCLEFLHKDTKGGYWFTYILLLMFVLYYLFAYGESLLKRYIRRHRWGSLSRRQSVWQKARRYDWLPITLLWLVWLAAYATWFMPSWFKYPKSDFMQWSSFGQVIQFFHFFLAGNIVRRYWSRFQRLFDSKWFAPFVIALAVVTLCEFLKWKTLRMQWTNLPRTLCMYSLMTVVILYFRHYAEAFSKQTVIGRTLQYIGVRTLDIYLIHVLFVPQMAFVGAWLKTMHYNFALDLSLSFLGAFVITGLSIMASNIIRISPLLKYYIFGRK